MRNFAYFFQIFAIFSKISLTYKLNGNFTFILNGNFSPNYSKFCKCSTYIAKVFNFSSKKLDNYNFSTNYCKILQILRTSTKISKIWNFSCNFGKFYLIIPKFCKFSSSYSKILETFFEKTLKFAIFHQVIAKFCKSSSSYCKIFQIFIKK